MWVLARARSDPSLADLFGKIGDVATPFWEGKVSFLWELRGLEFQADREVVRDEFFDQPGSAALITGVRGRGGSAGNRTYAHVGNVSGGSENCQFRLGVRYVKSIQPRGGCGVQVMRDRVAGVGRLQLVDLLQAKEAYHLLPFFCEGCAQRHGRVCRGGVFCGFDKVEVPADDVPVRGSELGEP